jgi:O-antigen/teichoic acid export membrane protein
MFGADLVGNWLYLAPISVFFGGVNAAFSALAIRRKFFRFLSINRIITALIVPMVSILIGLISASVLGLMAGLVTSQVIPTVLLLIHLVRKKSISWDLQKHSFIQLVKRYKNFPIYSLPSDFINNLSNQLPVLMLANIAGLQAIGYYNLCYRVLGLPSQIISTSVGEVFRQRATEDYFSKGSCRPIFLKVFKTLLLLSLAPFIILIAFGPELFAFVFGSTWKEAGAMAQIIGLLFVFKFIVSPLTYVINIANKQWISLIVDVLLLSVMGLIYAISVYYQLDYKTSLLIYSLSYSTLYFLTFLTCLKFTVYDKHKE